MYIYLVSKERIFLALIKEQILVILISQRHIESTVLSVEYNMITTTVGLFSKTIVYHTIIFCT